MPAAHTQHSTTAPLVSVVMPVLNPHPKFFFEAVASVLDQTLGDLELVIVEDPSERDAAPILEKFRDRRIRHIRNPRRTSLIEQRNRSIREARAPLVAQLDADDICYPNRLQAQYDFLCQQAQ